MVVIHIHIQYDIRRIPAFKKRFASVPIKLGMFSDILKTRFVRSETNSNI